MVEVPNLTLLHPGVVERLTSDMPSSVSAGHDQTTRKQNQLRGSTRQVRNPLRSDTPRAM